MIIKPLSINCHGNYQNIDNNVKQELKKLYPDDQAVGYSIGQFRDLIRISIISGK
jgi:hypothetical protein